MSKFVILHIFVLKSRIKAEYLSFAYGQMVPCFVQTEKNAHL